MPLTDEQRAALAKKVGDIQTMFASNRRFAYDQAAELRKTSKYKKSQGVCFAMSIDWLRRRLWNVYNAGAKAKRNFDAAKYTQNEKRRVALTEKHGRLQDAYQKNVAEVRLAPVQSILARFVQAGVVSSGMDRLVATKLDDIHGYQLDEAVWAKTKDGLVPMGAPNTHFAFKQKLQAMLDRVRGLLTPAAPALGLLVSMQGDGGHAIAFFFTMGQDVFFDPNFGEFEFAAPAQRARELTFVTDLWFDVYHRYYNMDALEFTLIAYQAPATG